MTDSYPVPLYSGLLEPKHYNRIGNAVWFFIWCISSTTKEEEIDGITWGLVLGSKPMKLSELAEPFGVDDKTVSRWLKTLSQFDYIKTVRTSRGIIIKVRNSKRHKKRSDKNVRSHESDQTEMSDHNDVNGQNCPITDDSGASDQTEMSDLKDIKDLTTTTTASGQSEPEPMNLSEPDSKSPYEQVENAYYEIHGRLIGTGAAFLILDKFITSGMPASFIIDEMKAIYKERSKKTVINGFAYYEGPIQEAWQKRLAITSVPSEVALSHSQTTPVPSGTVAKGQASKQDRMSFLDQIIEEERANDTSPTR